MDEKISILMNVFWGTLILFWLVSGINAKKSSFREPLFKQFVFYWLPLIMAVYLLGPDERFGNSLIMGHFAAHNNTVGLTGLVICLSGLITAIWARYLLGRNWSVSVQQKENHELIQTGAYKLVRHPIYTGLLLMFLGNAVIVGNWRGLLAVSIVLISFLFKLKKEEEWLTEIFGSKYIEYMQKTKSLIPWLI
jgi:protein-S-isoprenylcysteine O-methyltransferase Ste14